MDQRIFIISDLHLGGRPPGPGSPGFQMCSARGTERLAAFITWAGAQRSPERSLHLVLAGDIVDFLAEEEPFEAFTADDERARRKLARAMDRTSAVWESLSAFVGAGHELTLMLGNHDLELSLPGPRRELMQRLGRDRHPRWKVEFLDDNRAFVCGPLLVEHGNRYDEWNVVPHDVLRQVRSAASRGEQLPEVPQIAGSELVARVMNPLKEKYGFLDLLKPEDATVLPLLVALEPQVLGNVLQVAALKRRASSNTFNAQGRPRDPANIAAPPVDKEEVLLELARELGGVDTANIGALGLVRQRTQEAFRHALYRALRANVQHNLSAFHSGEEHEKYLRPARAAAERGFQLVVFGHTHHAKQIRLPNGGWYLNTGTWADLMRLPRTVLEGDEKGGQEQLSRFVKDLERNELSAWRKQVPTFAQVDLTKEGKCHGEVFIFRSAPDRAEPLPRGVLWEEWDRNE